MFDKYTSDELIESIESRDEKIKKLKRHINELDEQNDLLKEHVLELEEQLRRQGPADPNQKFSDFLVNPFVLKRYQMKVIIHDGKKTLEEFPHESTSYICCGTKKQLEIYAKRTPQSHYSPDDLKFCGNCDDFMAVYDEDGAKMAVGFCKKGELLEKVDIADLGCKEWNEKQEEAEH